MESSQLFFIIMFLYTIVLSIISINCTEKNNNLVTNQAALFVFGDSLFDAGNYKYINNNSAFQSNFFPYGQTTFKFPTGRVSDGRLITDFIGNKIYINLFTHLRCQKKLFTHLLSINVTAENAWFTTDPTKSTTKQ